MTSNNSIAKGLNRKIMDEIIPGLWIGDLPSALNVSTLKAHGIFSVLTAMRGRVKVDETFIRHQILLDDTEDADVLIHLLPSIHFIQAELDKGRGVLVHCHAGISRSATIVAAYLMSSKNIDTASALEIILKARPNVEPNENFLQQLEVFHQAQYKFTRRDKAIRMFYMERAAEEFMNGDGSPPETDMFAKFPRTPSDSTPATPIGPRRRIRCKMCRQELATREHMLDHGQLGPPTPAYLTPAGSRRPSSTQANAPSLLPSLQSNSRRPSGSRSRLSTPISPTERRPSLLSHGGLGDSLSMSTIDGEEGLKNKIQEKNEVGTEESGKGFPTSEPSPTKLIGRTTSDSSLHRQALHNLRSLSRDQDENLSVSALADDSDEDDPETNHNGNGNDAQKRPMIQGAKLSSLSTESPHPTDLSIEAAKILGRRLSEAVISMPVDAHSPVLEAADKLVHSPDNVIDEGQLNFEAAANLKANARIGFETKHPTTHLISPSDLAAQLYANPKLAGLRTPSLSTGNGSGSGSGLSGGLSPSKAPSPVVAPILANPKCSGYFVEPMKWMEPFLESGQMAGKIICPNKKCSAKLGNYDWAGVCCGCKEWVTPGFCINRSKVDEVSF